MNDIQKNINDIKTQLIDNHKVIVVSKTYPVEDIIVAYNCGVRDFGENKVQELCAKYQILKNYDITWHLIGHLQTNKVKNIAPFVSYIHSVDSLKILSEINRQAKNCDRKINCLLEFHIASEDTKFGLNIDEATAILGSEEYRKMQNIEICGVMGMASFYDDTQQIRREFSNLRNIFNTLKEKYFYDNCTFCEISMGMSNDWLIATQEGSTMLRIGTQIFGERKKNLCV
jgi:pyridoxal phosphate enzyme (YggS family)